MHSLLYCFVDASCTTKYEFENSEPCKAQYLLEMLPFRLHADVGDVSHAACGTREISSPACLDAAENAVVHARAPAIPSPRTAICILISAAIETRSG